MPDCSAIEGSCLTQVRPRVAAPKGRITTKITLSISGSLEAPSELLPLQWILNSNRNVGRKEKKDGVAGYRELNEFVRRAQSERGMAGIPGYGWAVSSNSQGSVRM